MTNKWIIDPFTNTASPQPLSGMNRKRREAFIPLLRGTQHPHGYQGSSLLSGTASEELTLVFHV